MSQVTAQSIAQQIHQDINACETLLTLLKKEQDALQSREIDALDDIIQQKTQQLSRLEKSALARREWVNLSGLKEDAESWQALLSDLKRPDIDENWQRLKTLMEECKAANEVNGKLLARSQEVFSRITGIMRGQSQNVSLYGATGRSTAGTQSHKFGEA